MTPELTAADFNRATRRQRFGMTNKNVPVRLFSQMHFELRASERAVKRVTAGRVR